MFAFSVKRFSDPIFLSLGAVALVFTIFFLGVYQTHQLVMSAIQWKSHTWEVIAEIKDLDSQLKPFNHWIWKG